MRLRGRSAGALAAAAALAVVAMGAARGEPAADSRWDRFPVFVWFYGGPRPGPKAFAVLKRAGLDGCNVEGNDESDAAHAAGLAFYVDHAAGKGDLYLRDESLAADRDRMQARTDLASFRPVRPNCFNDPAVRARLRERVADSVRRHAAHAPLAWVLDDELSVTRGVNPIDYCFGEECLRGLREQLRADYGTIEPLNAAWGTRFRDFAEAVPPTTEETRRANADRPIERTNFAAWNDHREFMRRSFAALVAELVGEIARDGGAGPAGFTGGEFPSAFGGFEGEELCAGCSLVEVYEAGVAPELARSFVRDGGRVVSTVFVPEKPGPRAAWSPWEVLARAGRGDDGAVIWSSGAIFAAGGDELNEAGRALAEAVAAAARLKSLLVERGAAPIAAPVALYENAATPRALWLLDSTADGATWPNRLTSWESSHSSSVASREGWAAALRAASLPYRFVGARGLLDGRLADEGVRCIVLHEAAALSDREIDGLLAFAREGGLVIGDADAAWFDERLRGREPAALARLFGVERPAGRTLAQVASEAADASTALHASEREVGRGATLWLGRRVMLRPDDAPEKGKGRELRRDLVELGREVAERLRARGFAASPRLPDDVAGRARLHRYRLAGGGELAIVVATAPAGAPLSTSLAFDEDVAVEPIEPMGRAIARLARGTPLPVVVDDRHAFVVRWSPER